MREIKEIILHCSATREGKEYHARDIDRWHKDKGWDCIGYHYVITLDGQIEKGRDEAKAGAHALGHNQDSIGICYIGGLDAEGNPKDTRTNRQRYALGVLLGQLLYKYPNARIIGHNEVAKKHCPCFDAVEYRKMFGQCTE